MKTTIKDKFIKDFGITLANKLESAAKRHSNGANSANKGSDPFKWVLLICIGYQCFEKEDFRKDHGISRPSFEVLKKWIRNNADLGSHDGDCDYLALASGAYKPFIKMERDSHA